MNAVTSFDVNKAIQRSLTKACARHGLGLYIYAGEDLPEDDVPEEPTPQKPIPKKRPNRDALAKYCNDKKIDMGEVAKTFKLSSASSEEQFAEALKELKASEVR